MSKWFFLYFFGGELRYRLAGNSRMENCLEAHPHLRSHRPERAGTGRPLRPPPRHPGGPALASPRCATCTLPHPPAVCGWSVSASPVPAPARRSTSSRIWPHELLYDLADRLAAGRSLPVSRPAGQRRRREHSRTSCAPRAGNTRPEMSRFQIGEGWWHGFEVPTFGPCGRRGHLPDQRATRSAARQCLHRRVRAPGFLAGLSPGLLSRRPFGRSTAPAGDRGARPSAWLRSRTSGRRPSRRTPVAAGAQPRIGCGEFGTSWRAGPPSRQRARRSAWA